MYFFQFYYLFIIYMYSNLKNNYEIINDNCDINSNLTSDTDSEIEINIKILNDIYEINLNKIIRKTNFVTTYEGLNITNNNKIIIDKYNTNILTLCKKISNNIITLSHPNIINILEIIIEKNTAYIIKEYHQTNINKYINNDLIKSEHINYCRQIFEGIYYLFTKNINIETLYIDNIFIENNKVIISPYFGEDKSKHQNILYGSPLYSPPELFNKYIPEKESIIVWNLGIIFYQLLFNKNPFENCKEYDDILDNNKILDNKLYDKYNDFTDIIFKMIDTNKHKRSTLSDVKYFFENYNNTNNNTNNNTIEGVFEID